MYKTEYKNLEELLKEVKATHGLNTNIEFITHMQDLIGHSSIEDLYNLSKEYKETFYWIYDTAEGTEATLKFFAENSKFSEDLYYELSTAEADRDKYKFFYEDEKKNSLKIAEERNNLENELSQTKKALTNIEYTAAQREKEIIELKAKLYDLMNK